METKNKELNINIRIEIMCNYLSLLLQIFLPHPLFNFNFLTIFLTLLNG